MIVRRPWVWRDPLSGNKHRIWHTPDLVSVLENVIEEENQAENFFEEYEKVCPYAEYNLAYHILLIGDPDIREDALDLFLISPEHHMAETNVISPRHVFETKNGGSSFGLKVDGNEIKRNRKITKAGKK